MGGLNAAPVLGSLNTGSTLGVVMVGALGAVDAVDAVGAVGAVDESLGGVAHPANAKHNNVIKCTAFGKGQ